MVYLLDKKLPILNSGWLETPTAFFSPFGGHVFPETKKPEHLFLTLSKFYKNTILFVNTVDEWFESIENG